MIWVILLGIIVVVVIYLWWNYWETEERYHGREGKRYRKLMDERKRKDGIQ